MERRDSAEGATARAAPRTPWRRRVAMLVLVVGAAGLFAYWSRQRAVQVTIIYDFGRQASRVARLSLRVARPGDDPQPVDLAFPSDQGAPRRFRHALSLRPGTYTLSGRVEFRAAGSAPAEVRRIQRRVTVSPGQDQRIVLRLSR